VEVKDTFDGGFLAREGMIVSVIWETCSPLRVVQFKNSEEQDTPKFLLFTIHFSLLRTVISEARFFSLFTVH
jgi:hypothetical protein